MSILDKFKKVNNDLRQSLLEWFELRENIKKTITKTKKVDTEHLKQLRTKCEDNIILLNKNELAKKVKHFNAMIRCLEKDIEYCDKELDIHLMNTINVKAMKGDKK